MGNSFSSFYGLALLILFAGITFLILKNRYIAKLAVRNFLRRKILTLLVIIGSMIGASLISSSLLVNDSFNASSTAYVNQKLGVTDGIIYPRVPTESWNLSEVNQNFALVSADFDTFLPIYYQRLSLKNGHKEVSISDAIVLSYDASLANIYDRNISKTDIVKNDEALVSKSIAQQLQVQKGDALDISILGNVAVSLKVKEIVDDNGLIGFNAPLPSHFGNSAGSVYVAPELTKIIHSAVMKASGNDTAQKNEVYNAILVARQNAYDTAALSGIVQNKLNAKNSNILFEELKNTLYERTLGNYSNINFGQILLIVSSFAILAGLVLMINLYLMLADERRSELGTLRTLGFSRFDVMKLFTFEGLYYSIISAFLGTCVGIGIGAVFLKIIQTVIEAYSQTFIQGGVTLSINLESMTYAFAGALIVNFLTTILLSLILSNITIADAVRDIKTTKRKKLSLIAIAIISTILVIGSFMIYYSLQQFPQDLRAVLAYFGGVAVIGSIGYFLSYATKHIKIASFFSAVIFLSTLLLTKIEFFAQAWRNNPYLFFITGVILIVSIVICIVENSAYITAALRILLKPFGKLATTAMLGLRYTSERQLRTGMTIVSLALIIFIVTLVSVLRLQLNTIIGNVNSEFAIVVLDQLGTENVSQLIKNRQDEIEGFQSVYTTRIGTALMPDILYKNIAGFDSNAPTGINPESPYKETITTAGSDIFDSNIKIKSTISLDEVKDKFLNSNEYILLGKNYFENATDFNQRPDLALDQKIKLSFPGNIQIERTVLGIIETNTDQTTGVTSRISTATSTGILLSENDYKVLNEKNALYFTSVYGLRINAESVDSASETVKNILKGKNITSITVVKETVESAAGFINQLIILVEGFMALGLIVGMAGLAVTLIRSIHERRRQIGAMLAIGLSQKMVQGVFLFETSFIAFAGITTGFLAGLGSAYMFYIFSIKPEANVNFTVPFPELSIIFGAVIISILIFSYFPAKNAGKSSISDALKFIG